MYYIYKERCMEEKDALIKKDKEIWLHKIKTPDDYLCESEEEKQTDRKPDKKEQPKNQQKVMWKNLINLLIKIKWV